MFPPKPGSCIEKEGGEEEGGEVYTCVKRKETLKAKERGKKIGKAIQFDTTSWRGDFKDRTNAKVLVDQVDAVFK